MTLLYIFFSLDYFDIHVCFEMSLRYTCMLLGILNQQTLFALESLNLKERRKRGAEEAGCKIYSGAPTVSQTAG